MIGFRVLVIRAVLLAALLPLAALSLLLLRDVDESGRTALDRRLLAAVTVTRDLLGRLPAAEIPAALAAVDPDLGIRLTLLRADGSLLADSQPEPGAPEDPAALPEVREALEAGLGRAVRRSPATGAEIRYLALVDRSAGETRVYRASASTAPVHSRVRQTLLELLAAGAAVLVLAVLISSRLARQVAAPVEALSDAAARFSAGDIRVHVIPDGPPALQRLGTQFNAMVDRTNSQVRRLDEAQGYLDAIIRQMPEGLLVLDSRATITHVNSAAETLLGLSSNRILGRPLLAVLMSYALDGEIRRVLDGSLGAAVDVRVPEGRSLRATVGPLEVGGRPAGATLILQDVTALRQVDEMRRDFVANVSHELRTPVAAIRALVETLMLRGKSRPALIEEYGPRIVAECERVDHLVRDLLFLAEMESGALRLSPEPLDPCAVVEDVVRQVEPLAAASGTRLELEPFRVSRVRADAVALGQCLRNLVDNAIRHAAGGTVRIDGRQDGDQVILSVADDGPGIPPEDLPRIFERFYRVDKARSREAPGRGGSGLGLAIVKHLVGIQGGRAWVESRVGVGSTFYLAFPRE